MKNVVFNTDELALLKKIALCARKEKVELFLVGGIIRDKIMKRQRKNSDIDFCLKRGAISFGRSCARLLKSGFVVLDQEHGACRLLHKAGEKVYTLDFTDFRAPTLEEDLLHRDFTINSIAVRVTDAVKGRADSTLVDLYGGCGDIDRKLLRLSHKEGFSHDPLRVLRAFSFSCLLGFNI
jgi:tRNA nucleotidyltransferase/poly(A) polymerase